MATDTDQNQDYVNGVAMDRGVDTNRVRQTAGDDQAIASLEKQLGAPAIENQERNAGLGRGFDTAKTPEGANLAKIAASAALNPAGSLGRIKKIFWSTPGRKTASVAGLGGGVVGGIIGIVMVLMPALKIPSAVSMIEDRFFANTNQIGETITERLITQYIVQKLIPGMITNQCASSKVDRTCASPGNADTYTGKLYNAWRDGRIEKKLYDQFGFEVARENGRWYISSDNLSERISLGEFDGSEGQRVQFERTAIQAMSRTDAKLAIKEVFNKETGATRRQMRQAGAVLERKYGIPRSLFSARKADWKEQNVHSLEKLGRSIVHRHVIGYYSESLGLAMDCMMDRNFSCTSDAIDDDGFKRTKFQTDLHAAAREYSAKFGSDSLDDVLAEADSIKEKGLGGHLAEKLVEGVPSDAAKTTIKIGTKAIPIVGWVDLAVVIGTVANKAPEAYPLVVSSINSQQAVSTFAMYALARDEYMAGDTDLGAYGALSQTLDASDDTDNGGTGAEDSPVLRAANGQQVTESVVCNDGERVDGGLLCSEEKLVPDSAEWLGGASAMLDVIGLGPAAEFGMTAWNATAGWILDLPGEFVGWVITSIPGYDKLVELASPMFKSVVSYFVETFVPSMLSGAPSGARLMNTAETGGAVLAQDLCETMGCQTVNPEVNAESSLAYIQQQEEEFSNKSMFARMFDTEDSHSFISQLALSTPTSTTSLASVASSILTSNPFAAITNNFMSGNKAHADTVNSLVQYYNDVRLNPQGIPKDDPLFTTDNYELLETEQLNCSNPDDPNRMKTWNDSAVRDWPELTLNPEVDAAKVQEILESGSFAGSAQYQYTTTNGCLTMQMMACANGSVYDESLCELEFGNGESATTSPESGAGGGSLGTSTDSKALAQQVLNNSNITLFSGFDNPLRQVTNVANGTNTASCNVSPYVLNLMLLMAEKHSIRVTSLNRACAADCNVGAGSLSFHCKDGGGHAMDIDSVDGNANAGQGTAQEIAMLRDIAPSLPSGTQIGQIECRPSGSLDLPPGVTEFSENNCTHLHINLPVYDY